MDRILLKALYVLLLSLGLAFVFNFLFFGKLIGISVFIFAVVLVGVVLFFAHKQQMPIKHSWWVVVLIGFFAFMPSVRDNEFLTFLNVATMFGLLMLLAYQFVGTPVMFMKLRDYFILAVMVPFRMLGKAFSTINLISQVRSKVKSRDNFIRALKGLLMALPILILFAILFSQADLAFAQFLKSFTNFSIAERTAQYIALLVFAFVAGLSFLSYIFFGQQEQKTEAAGVKSDEPIDTGKGTEVMVFLGLISALFLVFIAFQVTYLFGGETNIINAGFTYAEYARRGFWELLAVAIISLLLLLASEKYSGAESKMHKYFLAPAMVLIVEVVIIIGSAFKRLSLYIDAYGMTTLRFYVAMFIILLLVLFVVLAVKFIKSKREQFFTFGTLLTFAGFLALVNIINPDAYTAKINLEQYNKTGKIDVIYVKNLSSDAQAEQIEIYNKLPEADKEYLLQSFREEREYLESVNDHWQSANLSRVKALKLLDQME
jgi:hypothetical protein